MSVISAPNGKGEESAVESLMSSTEVVHPQFKFVNKLDFEDHTPNLQAVSAVISLETASVGSLWNDHSGYFTTFVQEIDYVAKIESLVEKGMSMVHTIYTYRSVSQSIPEFSIEEGTAGSDGTHKDSTVGDTNAKKSEINRKILDILRPEISKVRDLLAYLTQIVSLFHSCVTHLTNKDSNKEPYPECVLLALVKLLDIVVILDNLKELKPCLQKDFARYKRVVGNHPSVEIIEEVALLQNFLSNPDPKKAKHNIFTSLREEIKRVFGHENILLDMIELLVEQLEKQYFLTPEEQFRSIRVLPYVMLLADGEGEDSKSFNIFKTSKIKLSSVQRIFKKYPVIPLFGDMMLTMEYVLHISAHYDPLKMGYAWDIQSNDVVISTNLTDGSAGISYPSTSSSSSALAHYDLRGLWDSARNEYSQFVTKFTTMKNRLLKYPFTKVVDEVSVDMSSSVFHVVAEGLQLLSSWTTRIKLMMSWKYTHPCAAERLKLLGRLDSSTDGSTASDAIEGSEYARVLKLNFSKNELSILIDFIFMVKSLSAMLSSNESVLFPYLRFHVHHRIQTLVQRDLVPLLHRLDKRNKPILPTLLKLRALVADWLEGSDPQKDYKEYTRKHGSNILVQHPARVVGAAHSQLFILRAQIGMLCDSDSEVRRKQSIFSKADLERQDLEIFEKFYTDSLLFPYVLNFGEVISQISDLSEFWFREHYLEMTHCIQFPIEFSLPWILTEHLLTGRVTNTPMIENVLFLTDIYNDAAQKSLYVLNQQFLYDEIEAEANLVIDQFYFLLSEDIYSYYKALAASTELDVTLKHKLEVLKGSEYLTISSKRIESLMSQHSIQILGRTINLNFILTQNINNKIYRDIDLAIKRFESFDARGITELKTLIGIIQNAHSRLSRYLQLDNFDSMLSEVNESFAPSSFRGRISLHMLSSLAKDIFPNFSYNYHTHRFVPSPIAIRPMQYGKAPKQSTMLQAFGGPVFHKVFEMCGRLTRGFFGRVHIEAYLSLGVGNTDLAMLVDQLLKNTYDKIVDVSEYLEALKSGIPPCAPPKFLFKTVGGYGYYEGKLRALLDYDDLKTEVFQNFREIGNSIAFFMDLSDALELLDQFDFMMIAPFLGVIPVHEGSHESLTPMVSQSPLVKVVNHVSNELKNHETLQTDCIKSTDVWSRMPAAVQRLAEVAANQIGVLDMNDTTKTGKSLSKWILLQIEEFLYQENLTVEWAAYTEPRDKTVVFPVKNAVGFHRLWSALSFLFCIVDGAGEDSANANPTDTAGEGVTLISNEAEFGHGFPIAGVMLLHLLGQRSVFETLDFSRYVLQLDAHESKAVESTLGQDSSVASGGPKVEESLLRETRSFVDGAKTQLALQTQLFQLFDVLHKTRDSYTKHSANPMIFHPPIDC